MASEVKDRGIFEEDEVSIVEGGIYKCGLVLESAEYISSDDEDETDDLFEKVTTGTVRVTWHPDGTEEVIQESKLTLEDRSLVPGDVVRHLIEGEDSQRGFVMNSRIICHLQILGSNYVIKNVDSRDLEPLQNWEIDPGDVYLDSWVGKIDAVTEILHVTLPDGTSFKIDSEEGLNIFEDATEKRNIDSEFYSGIFYEGQYVKAAQKDLYRHVKKEHPKYQWPKKKGDVEYICKIKKIEVKKIEVHWLCHGCAENESFDDLSSPPPSKLRKDNIARLKSLDCFASTSIQLGDKTRYTVKPSDVILNMDTKKPLLHCIMHDGDCGVNSKNQKNLLQHSPTKSMGDDTSNTDIDSASNQPAPDDVAGHLTNDISRVNGQCSKSGQSDSNQPDSKSFVKPSSVPVSDSNTHIKQANWKQDAQNTKDEMTEFGDEADQVFQDGNVSAAAGSWPEVKNVKDLDSTLGSVDHQSETVLYEGDEDVEQSESDESNKATAASLYLRGIHCKKNSQLHQTYGSVEPISFPKPGDSVPVEVLYTVSYLDVMWQDGSTEKNILSSVLYPIHHLDELEFFPGDYVISSSADIDSNSYGVVESVQHRERTCMVQWMSTSNRSAVNIEPEEVSVYDIKDHPEYRFRPGHVVVRVGGYESGALPSEAVAGQVYELGKSGKMLIQWADGKRSHCCPQDLYLIENEFSELSDSADDPNSEESSSDDSWITEEETEADADNNEIVKSTSTVLFIEASQKVVLDQIMDRALTGLQQLEEQFNQALISQKPDSIAHILEDLLCIHQQCRLLDKTLKTSYFRDRKLTLAIQGVKSMLGKKREESMVQKARDLYQANTGKIAKQACDKDNNGEASKAKPPAVLMESDEVKSDQNDELDRDPSKSTGSGKGSPLQDADDDDDSESSDKDNDSPISEDLEILALLQEFLDMDLQTKELLDGICKKSGQSSPEGNKEGDPDEPKSEDNVSWWIKYLDETSFPPGLLVSRMVCHCLQAQLGKVLTDLTEKWEELKKCGKLKVLDDEDIDNDEDTTASAAGAADGDTGDSVDHDVNSSGNNASLNEGSSVDPESFSSEKPISQVFSERSQFHLQLTPHMQEKGADVFQSPLTPQTPADIRAKLDFNKEGFTIEEMVPTAHKFHSSESEQKYPKSFSAAVRKEMRMLKTGLPRGIYVKGFSNRMDLYSVMMLGPSSTPYEDGLFFFEIQLPAEYPNTPPHVHYVSFSSDKLNPNLYVDGKVCVSLLGTWIGKGSEVWTSSSSLLQLLISMQGLVLVSEPYYNEAGYEKQKGTQHGYENSRMYNEMVLLKVVESMTTLCTNPLEAFRQEISDQIKIHAPRMIHRLEYWLNKAADHMTNPSEVDQCSADSVTDEVQSLPTQCHSTGSLSDPKSCSLPDFPLFPLSRGFQITLKKLLSHYKQTLFEKGYCDKPL